MDENTLDFSNILKSLANVKSNGGGISLPSIDNKTFIDKLSLPPVEQVPTAYLDYNRRGVKANPYSCTMNPPSFIHHEKTGIFADWCSEKYVRDCGCIVLVELFSYPGGKIKNRKAVSFCHEHQKEYDEKHPEWFDELDEWKARSKNIMSIREADKVERCKLRNEHIEQLSNIRHETFIPFKAGVKELGKDIGYNYNTALEKIKDGELKSLLFFEKRSGKWMCSKEKLQFVDFSFFLIL